MKPFKRFNDPIHGYLQFPSLLVTIIDTPHFQRLRYLKQLGSCSFVFPAAVHTRFEHSLGVAHLARIWLEKLTPSLPQRLSHLVQIAALCHDLGHGPFSHMFDNHVIPKLTGKEFHHEDMSVLLFRDMVKKFKIDLLETEVDMICNMIMGNSEEDERKFLYQIVCNKKNGLDVDKMDYLVRDSTFLGTGYRLDINRIIDSSRIINNEICFYYKDAFNIAELYRTRFTLHRQCYNHPVVQAIQLMLIDVLLLVADHFDFAGAISDPEKYLLLTDDLIGEVKRGNFPEAKIILQRLETRKLYHLVEETIDTPVSKDGMIVKYPLNYSMGSSNPIEKINFYKVGDEIVHLKSSDISHLLPQTFQEYCIRVYQK